MQRRMAVRVSVNEEDVRVEMTYRKGMVVEGLEIEDGC
jgi:hypothetical protein